MVFLYRVPVFAYDCFYALARAEGTFDNFTSMNDTVGYFGGVFDYEFSAVRFYNTAIADLPPSLGI